MFRLMKYASVAGVLAFTPGAVVSNPLAASVAPASNSSKICGSPPVRPPS